MHLHAKFDDSSFSCSAAISVGRQNLKCHNPLRVICHPCHDPLRPDFGRDQHSSDSLRGIVFPTKPQKLFTKFSGLATSGRHNSAMNTNAESQLVPLRDV